MSTLLYGINGAPRRWLREGAPTWAGCQFAPGASVPAAWYGHYAETPDVTVTFPDGNTVLPSLFDRDYSGIGFLSLMQQEGLDPWSRLPGMLRAAATGGDLVAYQSGVAGGEQQLLDAWASSYFRLPNYGADWDMQGTCSPPDSDRSDPHQLTVANGTSRSLDADPFTVRLYRLDSKADLVHVTVDKGSLRINGSGVDDPHVSDALLLHRRRQMHVPANAALRGTELHRPAPKPRALRGAHGGSQRAEGRRRRRQEDLQARKASAHAARDAVAEPVADNTLTYSGTLDGSGPNGDATVTVHVAWTEHATSPGNDPSTVTWQLDSLTGTFSQSGGTGAPPCSATLSIKPGYAAAFGPGISHLPGQSTYDLKVHSPADGQAG